ncbi:hypothetical protein [Halomarina litorea]|uniref:hypothetical protein n=1 Tax=Halomarina litorea TaxID=2961595 RepID=UPI0020C2355D|nr:hypothetical protein [Halomarina sp. BCD28]
MTETAPSCLSTSSTPESSESGLPNARNVSVVYERSASATNRKTVTVCGVPNDSMNSAPLPQIESVNP